MMNKRQDRKLNLKKKAVTLVELMITSIIIFFVLVGLVAILKAGSNTWNTSMALVELQQNTRQAMEGVTREIRQALPASVSLTNSSTIVFSVPNSTESIVYYLDGANDQIIRIYPTGTNIVVANNIEGLEFCCLGGLDCFDCSGTQSIEVKIKAKKTSKGGEVTFPVTTADFLVEKVRLRNE